MQVTQTAGSSLSGGWFTLILRIFDLIFVSRAFPFLPLFLGSFSDFSNKAIKTKVG